MTVRDLLEILGEIAAKGHEDTPVTFPYGADVHQVVCHEHRVAILPPKPETPPG
jgi:hypothetical protein